MNDQQSGIRSSPKGALVTTRVIWAALLVGQISFLFVMLLIWSQRESAGGQPQDVADDVTDILGYVAIAMLFVLTPLGYFIRNQVYKANWRGNIVTPHGYIVGNIILLAMLEGVAMLGLIGTFAQGSFGLPFVPTVIAMAIQVINFPHGRPMYDSNTLGGDLDRGER